MTQLRATDVKPTPTLSTQVYSQGYYEVIPLNGIVKGTIQSPTEWQPKSALGYCNDSKVPCVSWDLSLVSEVQPNQGLFVPTRIKMWTEELNATCGEFEYHPGCSPWVAVGSKQLAYMGDVESGTVLLQHSASRADTKTQKETVANSFTSDR